MDILKAEIARKRKLLEEKNILVSKLGILWIECLCIFNALSKVKVGFLYFIIFLAF